jgi:hypothetical protein
MDAHRRVRIQLGNPGSCGLIAGLADILGAEEEL